VGILVSSLAQELGYRGERLVEAGMGGLLHDIGKMRVPEYILNKPGKYTDIEFKVMKRHPTYGVQLIEGKKGISPLTRAAIEQHHERFDGSGYARGLKGDEIEEIGVICAVADVYDALTSDRVYRAAWTPQKALAMIFQGRDKEYSKKIVELFTAHLGIYPVGSFVKLVGGQMGIVVRVERGKLLAPRVLVLFDESGRRLGEPFELNLAACKGAENGKKIQMSLNPKAFRVNVAEYLQSSGGQGFSA
jgi:HD-GYP domain-containing protein (c-di-GMP phosphodiesterase class II)